MEKTPEEIKAELDAQEAKDKKDEDVKNKKETYTASEYGEVLSESIERRKEIKTLRDSLKGFEDAEKIKQEKDMETKDLLTKRDAEILDLKNQVSQTTLRNDATTMLMEQGFPQKLLRVALPNDLTEENLPQKVKDFTKEYKEYAVIKESDSKPPRISPFQPGPKQKDEKVETRNKFKGVIQETLEHSN